MLRLILVLLGVMSLGGCIPFAMFAQGGNAYSGYRQSLGTFVTSSNVNAVCLSPRLRLAIWSFEGNFGRKIVMSSGYRDPVHNSQVGGVEDSFHTKCMAADFFIPGVDKRRLIAFAMSNDLVGGLGCYPGHDFIHVDVRDRPRGWTRPVTFRGC